MIIKIYMNKSGLNMVFNSNEMIIIDELLNEKSVYIKPMHELMKYRVSRTTVYNILEKLKDLDIVSKETETSTGGWKGKYVLNNRIYTDASILVGVQEKINDKFINEFLNLKKVE